MGKLIFLDIDGTLAMPGQPPSRMNIAAIQTARLNGHKVFLSTGRMEISVEENIRAIGFDGGIYGAGGRVIVGGHELIDCPMSSELVQEIADVLEEEHVPFKIESISGTYQVLNGQVMHNCAHLHYFDAGSKLPGLRDGNDFIPTQSLPIYKILFLATTKEQVKQIRQRLCTVAKVVCFTGLVPDFSWIPGEISDWSVNKGKALIYICQHYGVDPSECIAFGDSMNDAEILQAAGVGIAMGNAEMCVKEIADQVCEHCKDDGIAKALTRMKLI